jgi:hypothetical protein
MYACASDYIRLFAVYRYGGIYLDMDMEIIKPFEELLNEELMIAYENHINQNIEAGCFGAVSGHEYIKGCMEYFEGRPFFEEGEREKILEMEETERHEYINPVILPEIMKDRLRHFKDRGYPIYNRDYFTAKNIVTGAIEKSEKTYTIHHFATQYHSEEWRKGREMEQRIRRIFGEGTIVSKIVQKVVMVINRMRREGIRRGVEHYYKKYIKDKGRRKKKGT